MTEKFSSQSTDSLRELLVQSQTTILISTYQAGQLVLVRAQQKGLNTHFISTNRPMGIAVRENEFAIGEKSSINFYRNLAAVAKKTDDAEFADACYLHRKTFQTGAIDIHEMGFDKNNKLWFINTKMSCLATLNDDYSFFPEWRPPFISNYDLTDRCHLNGLGFRNGKPRYVSMLGAYDTAGGWRQNKISGGQIMDITTNEVLVDGLCMPHSPRWYRDKLYFLSSGAGQLISLIPGESPQVVAELPGFARGMDFIERYALIGLSQIRESSTFAGLPLTKKLDDRQSGLWVVDLDTGKTVAFLKFTGNVQEVFDIKVLPHKFATIIESNSPLIESSYELPDFVLNNLPEENPLQQLIQKANKLHIEKKFTDAIIAYKKILSRDENHRQINHQLGMCYIDANQWEHAIQQLEKVIQTQQDNIEAMNSLGLAWNKLNNSEKAYAWYDKAIAIDKQFALAHFNRSLMLLKQGDYKEGWKEYEWRWQTPQFTPFECKNPKWQGEDISNKRLLVHSEQGNGDHILFLRFLSLAAQKCKELIYIGPEKLAPLVAEIPGVSESRVPGQLSEDSFDVWCPLMSLTHCLGITLNNLPSPDRYLIIPKNVVVSQLKGNFKVGISWAGSATHPDDKYRSIALKNFSSILDVRNISFFSLQMPISAEEKQQLKSKNVTNLEPELPGYARTAALVDQLDLIITVDTAIAHVAAALGKETWVLLANDPDWRWLDDRNDSPWYPTVTLFRQQKDKNNWNEVLQTVKYKLKTFNPKNTTNKHN